MDSTQQDLPLPPELLARVLQCPQLSQSDVLGPCSLVARDWRSAAASTAAARGMEVQPPWQSELQGQQADSACAWLAKYGSQLRGLYWWAQRKPLKLCLPYSNLCQLQVLNLRDIQLVHRPDAAASAAIAQCCCERACPLTALTSLKMLVVMSSGNCNGGLCCLSALRALQQLELWEISCSSLSAALPGLVQLTQLTSVQLDGVTGTVEHDAPLQFDSLQHLRELHVESSPGVNYHLLPSSLTRLVVSFKYRQYPVKTSGNLVVGSSSTPGIASLTALQKLVVDGAKFVDPAVLAQMSQLSSVALDVAQFSTQSLAALLAVLPCLQQLRDVAVRRCCYRLAPDTYASVDWQQLPAACCLPHLTALYLKDMSWSPEAGQHIFGTAWQYPALSMLTLDCVSGFADDGDVCDAAVLGAGDLARLASCCPALEFLSLVRAVQPRVEFSPLAQLKSLTQLVVGGLAVNDASGRGLAQLTQLQCLDIYDARELTDAGLLCLTRLTCLHYLHASEVEIGSELDPDGDGCLSLSSQVGSVPDVWQQLASKCRASSVCWQLMLQEMRDGHVAKQAADGLQRRNTLLQQQVAAMQQQIVLLQQRVVALQLQAGSGEP